jgi:mono/diheme cytochrome c family protein
MFASISYRAMRQGTVGVPHPRTGLVPTSDNQGQVLFGRYCDSCHPAGRVGIGTDLRSREIKRQYTSADQIAKVIRKGGYDMPAFPPDLVSDKELEPISQYVLSLPEESH